MASIPLDVVGCFTVDGYQNAGYYYGPPKPDLAILHVKVRNHPVLAVDPDSVGVKPGARMATAGFTMGTDALCAPGWLHQMTPTLQDGIVSAVLPFPCEAHHGLMINIMTQGGASGSPVFPIDSPAASGVLYGGLNEPALVGSDQHAKLVSLPTNFSYCVAGRFLKDMVEFVHGQDEFRLSAETQTLAEMIETMPRNVAEPQVHLKPPSDAARG